MEIKKLNYFIHVAELGSFTRASIALGIEQSTLSRHIRALEQELGVLLFHRDGRGVNTTAAGKSLLARSRRIMAELSMLTHDLAMLSEEPIGTIKVGVPPSIAEYLAPGMLQMFISRYPRMTIEVVEGPSGVLFEWLSNGRLDAAILYLVPATRALGADVLFTEDLVLVMHPKVAPTLPAEVTFADLHKVNLALPSTDHGIRTLVENAARKADVDLHCAFHISGIGTLKRLVRAGHVSAIMPESAILPELKDGELCAKRFKPPGLERTVLLALGAQVSRTESLQELCGMIRKSVAQIASSNRWRPFVDDKAG